MNNIKKQTKYIFMTGGVISGLGKGVSVAALGRVLKAKGFKVFVQKFDPYYNIDPGTMDPYQHGEVYVTKDGGETDLDLGHYERFIDESFTKDSNLVQGRLLQELLNEERDGKYDGNTIQVVPHVTNKIIEKIERAGETSGADFVITEIGGTVGDIESLPFIYAIGQFSRKHADSSFFIHTTFVPYLETSLEFKSKPTQNSVTELQRHGVLPNMLILRANKEMEQDFVKKVANKTFLDEEFCIPLQNVDNIYKVPLYFEKFKMADKILDFFKIKNIKTNLKDWKKYVNLIDETKIYDVEIAMVGKYVEYEDAYKSIVEALKISGNWNKTKINFRWIQASDITTENIETKILGSDGVVILPGFGKRGLNGKIITSAFTREKDIPTLGICYGMQAMVINQAAQKGIQDPTSSEVSDKGTFVIDIIRGKQKDKIGGTLRLGISKTIIKKGSLTEKIYNSEAAFERHRHRYEVNSKFIPKLETKDFYFSGFDEATNLAEICEMPNKKFYVGIQAHPEFNANPLREHPLFKAFLLSLIK